MSKGSSPVRPARSLSQSDIDILRNGKRVEAILPVERGSLRLPDARLVCDCGQEVSRGNMRGRVSEPAPGVTVVELVGLCATCHKATPYVLRMRPAEDRFEEWSPRSGWVAKRLARRRRRPPWWDLVGWLRRLL